jgi:hypothetical protein
MCCLSRSAVKNTSCIVSYVVLCLGITYYAVFVGQFFPGPKGFIAFDYRYFLPLVLSGKYFAATNGYLAVPIFSPSFCGGLPFLANPQSMYYSVPQLLSELANPILSFYITALISSGVGAGSTYFLLRRRFALSYEAAALGGLLFMLNGFLLHRMLVAHVTYHAIGLTPLACILLIEQSRHHGLASISMFAKVLGMGVIVAYFVYCGALNMVIPLGLAVLLVWLVHAILSNASYYSLWVGVAGALLGGMLSAAKLVPAFVYVQTFPRPGRLALFDTPFRLLSKLAIGLFFPFLLKDWVSLGSDAVARHEGEYGVGIIPPSLIALALIVATQRHQLTMFTKQLVKMWPYLLGFVFVCLIPIVVDFWGVRI